jgi:hypothetical protein
MTIPVENLLTRLSSVRKTSNGWSARCPAHDDRHSSLSIAQGDDGTVLVKCHAGCTLSAIVSAVGMEVRDLFPPKASATPNRTSKPKGSGRTFSTANAAVADLEQHLGKRSALWTYRDARGEPVGVVVRWDRSSGKEILPVARHADGWRIRAMPEPRPLYGLAELTVARRVVVCEGEKCADKARALGFAATTSAGGSEAATKTDWRPLAAKEVWILPDNDAPGRKYADTVAGILAKLTPAPLVRVVELPGLPEGGGDIMDWIDAHGEAAEPDGLREEIEVLARTVELWCPAGAHDLVFRPFPLYALPGVLADYIREVAIALGCDVAMVAPPVPATCAGCIGNTRVVSPKRDWREPLVTWAVVIADPSTLKSPAHDKAVQPIRDIQAEIFAHYKRELKAFNRATDQGDECEKPPDPRIIQVSDTTIEKLIGTLDDNPRGVLLEMDELRAWFNSFTRYKGSKGGTDAPQWLSIHRAGPIRYDRKTGHKRCVHVPHAAVSVCGTIQREVLASAINGDLLESGMAARLLVAMAPSKKKKWSEVELSPDTEDRYATLIRRLLALPQVNRNGIDLPYVLRLDRDAKAVWVDHYDKWAKVQHEAEGPLKAAFGKLEGGALRFVALHHICMKLSQSDGTDESPVSADSMMAGIILAKWFAHEAERTLAMLGETDTDRDQRRLIEWIERKGGSVTARDTQQGCRWLKNPGEAETAFEELVKAGRGIWRDMPTTAKGGRPAWAFVLSTPSTVYETPATPEESEGFVDVDSVDAPENGTAASDGRSGLFGDPTPVGPYRDRS